MIIEIDKIKEKQKKKLNRRLRILDNYSNEKKMYKDFMTITFKSNEQYIQFRKRKFGNLLRNLKKNYALDSYFWVLEFQKRGVVHYHLLLLRTSDKKIGFIDKKKAYKDFVGYTNIKRVWTSVISYLTKYLQKQENEQKQKIIIKEKHKFLPICVSKKYKYRSFGFGGKIRKIEQYIKIMKHWLEQKYGVEIKKEGKNNVITYGYKKIEYRFKTKFTTEGLEIYKGYITVYTKKLKNLYEFHYVFDYEYEINIENEEDLTTFWQIILLELDLLELN